MGVRVTFDENGSIRECEGSTATETLYTLMMMGVHRPMTPLDWTATIEELAAMLPETQRLLTDEDGKPEGEAPK